MSTQSFADLGVSRAVIGTLAQAGITEPFAIQRFGVAAPDRAAYAEALLAVERDGETLATHGRTLLDERLRSPDLVAHVRAVAGRYDAFLFLDVAASTTVYAVGDVAEHALVVPLLIGFTVARYQTPERAGRVP